MTNLEFQQVFQEKLKERGYTLKQLSEATSVSLAHLESLSHGRFENLPPAPYVHGYLEKIGEVLAFDPEPWWNEIKHHEDMGRSGEGDRLPDNRFFRKPQRAWVVGGAVIIVLLIYFGFRFSLIMGRPELDVQDPREASTQTNVERFVLRGTVQNGDLYINNERIEPRDDGSWEKELLLQSGPNTVEIRAKKFLGRENVVVRQIFYTPPTQNLTP